jgi:rare lipoprotein A
MTLKKIRFLLLLFLVKHVPIYGQQVPLGFEIFGAASYYGSKFYGNKTASGEILDKNDLTCAHPTLPFGTMLEVTNLANNKWCVVRVNDRGPYSHGRILDVTHKAAKHLGMFGSGIIKVKVTIVGDHNIVYIGRPESVTENSMELVKDDENVIEPKIPLKQNKNIVKTKQSKNITKKRAARKKKH